jgi:hypothetical protein
VVFLAQIIRRFWFISWGLLYFCWEGSLKRWHQDNTASGFDYCWLNCVMWDRTWVNLWWMRYLAWHFVNEISYHAYSRNFFVLVRIRTGPDAEMDPLPEHILSFGVDEHTFHVVKKLVKILHPEPHPDDLKCRIRNTGSWWLLIEACQMAFERKSYKAICSLRPLQWGLLCPGAYTL